MLKTVPAPTYSTGRAQRGQHAVAQLPVEPQLHADEGLPALLGQLGPGLGAGQHVTHAALRQTQHLHTHTHTHVHTHRPPHNTG